MSEKRFVIDEKTNYKDYPIILDNKTGDWWVIQDTMMGTEKLLDLLNTQQDTISALHEENTSFKENQGKRRAILWWEHYKEKWANAEKELRKLKEENEQLKQEVFIYKKAFQEQVQRCSL